MRPTNRSTACPVSAGFDGDVGPAMLEAPSSGDVAVTCTVVAFFFSG